ncbi:hypothetical protein AB0K74_26510 [Streptomyces sp. NPDC056159]|uniref:hypothetical protein n=1 Tax=Streptomyces sp. NPDC056159 TaxID=3155537 RepID=UPI003448AADB
MDEAREAGGSWGAPERGDGSGADRAGTELQTNAAQGLLGNTSAFARGVQADLLGDLVSVNEVLASQGYAGQAGMLGASGVDQLAGESAQV